MPIHLPVKHVLNCLLLNNEMTQNWTMKLEESLNYPIRFKLAEDLGWSLRSSASEPNAGRPLVCCTDLDRAMEEEINSQCNYSDIMVKLL